MRINIFFSIISVMLFWSLGARAETPDLGALMVNANMSLAYGRNSEYYQCSGGAVLMPQRCSQLANSRRLIRLTAGHCASPQFSRVSFYNYRDSNSASRSGRSYVMLSDDNNLENIVESIVENTVADNQLLQRDELQFVSQKAFLTKTNINLKSIANAVAASYEDENAIEAAKKIDASVGELVSSFPLDLASTQGEYFELDPSNANSKFITYTNRSLQGIQQGPRQRSSVNYSTNAVPTERIVLVNSCSETILESNDIQYDNLSRPVPAKDYFQLAPTFASVNAPLYITGYPAETGRQKTDLICYNGRTSLVSLKPKSFQEVAKVGGANYQTELRCYNQSGRRIYSAKGFSGAIVHSRDSLGNRYAVGVVSAQLASGDSSLRLSYTPTNQQTINCDGTYNMNNLHRQYRHLGTPKNNICFNSAQNNRLQQFYVQTDRLKVATPTSYMQR